MIKFAAKTMPDRVTLLMCDAVVAFVDARDTFVESSGRVNQLIPSLS
jgi:hypothetical protein